MAITKTETKKTTVRKMKVAEEVALSPDIQLVDEYVGLYQWYEKMGMKSHISRMENTKKLLQEIANQKFQDNETAILKGTLGEVVYSPKTEVTEVMDAKGLFQDILTKFGEEVAFSVIKFNLTTLRTLLSASELETYVQKVPGSRSLKATVPNQ